MDTKGDGTAMMTITDHEKDILKRLLDECILGNEETGHDYEAIHDLVWTDEVMSIWKKLGGGLR